MRSVSDAVIGEISRSLDFFAATSSDARINNVLLSGGAALTSGFATAFSERTGLGTEIMDPLSRMLPSKGFEAEYLSRMGPILAVSIGLATRRFDS
jgi:type IV pilus assembly protein PilM